MEEMAQAVETIMTFLLVVTVPLIWVLVLLV